MPDPVTVPTAEEIQSEVTAAEEVYQYNLRANLPRPQAAVLTVPTIQGQDNRQAAAPTAVQIGEVRIRVMEEQPRPVPARPKFYY